MKFATVLILAMAISAPASSQTSGTFTHLEEGEAAPFSGTLMDVQAIATIINDKKFCKKEAKIESDLKCNLEKELIKKELQDKSIEQSICESKTKELLRIKEEENTKLKEELESNSNDYSLAWLSGGVIGGIALSLTVFWISVQIVGG